MTRIRPWILLFCTVSIAVTSVACRRSPPTPYLRLSGAAPVLADVPGTRAHLIVFWAAWCIPCREEVPDLVAFSSAPPPDLSVVLVRTDSMDSPGGEVLGSPPDASLHVRFDDQQLFQRIGAQLLPSAVLIVDGQLVARLDGVRKWNDSAMRELLARLINEPGQRRESSAN